MTTPAEVAARAKRPGRSTDPRSLTTQAQGSAGNNHDRRPAVVLCRGIASRLGGPVVLPPGVTAGYHRIAKTRSLSAMARQRGRHAGRPAATV
jgi:hypothetical protein